MEILTGIIGSILFVIIGFGIFFTVYFTLEHYLVSCSVIVPEYRGKHTAADYREALEWIAQYPTGTECQIYNRGKLIATKY